MIRQVPVVLGAVCGREPNEVEARALTDAWSIVAQRSNRLARWGMALALGFAWWSPLLLQGTPRTLRRVSPQRREALLVRMSQHRWPVLREFVLLFKFVAALARFREEQAVQASHFKVGDASGPTGLGDLRRAP